MNKPKSKLETELSEEQQAELADWLLTGMPYYEAKVKVFKEFALSVATSAFSAFWERVCVPQMLHRRSQQGVAAEARAEEAKRNPSRFTPATIDALEERAHQLANDPRSNVKDVKSIFALVLKHEEHLTRREELNFTINKWQWDAAKECLQKLPELKVISTNPKLSQEDKITAIRRALFGQLPEDEAKLRATS